MSNEIAQGRITKIYHNDRYPKVNLYLSGYDKKFADYEGDKTGTAKEGDVVRFKFSTKEKNGATFFNVASQVEPTEATPEAPPTNGTSKVSVVSKDDSIIRQNVLNRATEIELHATAPGEYADLKEIFLMAEKLYTWVKSGKNGASRAEKPSTVDGVQDIEDVLAASGERFTEGLRDVRT